MHIQLNINTDVDINGLEDLPKLKMLMESSNMKINKSQLARELGVDRRTVRKYLDGYTKKKREINHLKLIDYTMKLNSYCLQIRDSIQKFYYKRVLWQYLKDNHGLDCSLSNFRAYILKKPEFQQYFDDKKGRHYSREVIQFETPPGEQAQLDWKENIKYITKDGEILYVFYLAINKI